MTIKNILIQIDIGNLDSENEGPDYLRGWLKAATQSALLGNQKDLFKFSGDKEADIKVEQIYISKNGHKCGLCGSSSIMFYGDDHLHGEQCEECGNKIERKV